MGEDQFEWDAAKAEANLTKHGIAFEAAQTVFDDAFAWEWCDVESDPGETRYVIVGTANGVVVTVIYTERGNRTRIISARKATANEAGEYYRSQKAE